MISERLDITGDFFDGEVVEIWCSGHLLGALQKDNHGASRATLLRRVTYGGRKARSASRRLYEADVTFRKIRNFYQYRYGLAH